MDFLSSRNGEEEIFAAIRDNTAKTFYQILTIGTRCSNQSSGSLIGQALSLTDRFLLSIRLLKLSMEHVPLSHSLGDFIRIN